MKHTPTSPFQEQLKKQKLASYPSDAMTTASEQQDMLREAEAELALIEAYVKRNS